MAFLWYFYTLIHIYIYIQQEVSPRPIGKPPAPRVDIYIYIYVYYIIQSTISCNSLYAHLIFDQKNHEHKILTSIFILPSSSIFPNVSPEVPRQWSVPLPCMNCRSYVALLRPLMRPRCVYRRRGMGALDLESLVGKSCWLGGVNAKHFPNDISTHFEKGTLRVNIPGLQII